MKKRLLAVILAGAMMISLTACGNSASPTPSKDEGSEASSVAASNTTQAAGDTKSADSGKDVTLTVWASGAGPQVDAMKTACEGFSKESGYKVEFSAPGDTYEELMKTKMAANDMPDVFDTHGWSVKRYSDFLMPVNDLDFAANIDKQIKPIVSDEDGNIYVLPMDMDISGLVYNVDVVKEAGIDVDQIKTWDDFEAACDKVLAIGKNPIHMGGANSFTVGWFYDRVAPSFYITDDANSKAEELKSGTFDKEIWKKISAMLDSWVTKGYLNKDCVSGEYTADVTSAANGDTAFLFYGNVAMSIEQGINKDVKLGMMPIPSCSKDDEPSLIAGENVAFGIWKDTKHKDAAVELLEYLSRPEVASTIAKATGNKPALTTVTADIGMAQEYLDKYADVETFPYFDREYCPSGLWDVICSTGQDVLAQKAGAIDDGADQVAATFSEKFGQ